MSFKSERFPGGAIYPAWHNSKRFIAFNTSKISLFAHSKDIKRRTEAHDTLGDIMIYDIDSNMIIYDDRIARADCEESYPHWGGNTLYYCMANNPIIDRDSVNKITGVSMYDLVESTKKVKYSLMSIEFDTLNLSFGKIDTLVNGNLINKSVSLPRVSPCGNFIVFCLSNYGTFHIWHPESDLYMYDLRDNTYRKLENINSDESESYHTWSSNGRWMVFSSKREDGRYARPYFCFIDKDGNTSKPFVLPQKDPMFYTRFLKSYNVPELIMGRANTSVKESNKAGKATILVPNKY